MIFKEGHKHDTLDNEAEMFGVVNSWAIIWNTSTNKAIV